MIITIPTIVEGQGEVAALPILLRRLSQEYFPEVAFSIPTPHRIPRDKIINRPQELTRAIQLAALKGGDRESSFILLVLDADDDCPAKLGPELSEKARSAREDFHSSVTVIPKEYESWFLASANSLRGVQGLAEDLDVPIDLENIRDAKGWLKRQRKNRVYSPTIDQPKITAQFDLAEARSNSPSFARFCQKFQELVVLLITE